MCVLVFAQRKFDNKINNLSEFLTIRVRFLNQVCLSGFNLFV